MGMCDINDLTVAVQGHTREFSSAYNRLFHLENRTSHLESRTFPRENRERQAKVKGKVYRYRRNRRMYGGDANEEEEECPDQEDRNNKEAPARGLLG